MRFGVGLLQHFGAEDGAWSEVTSTEVGDSQITATGEEAELLESFFGKATIHVGRVGLNPTAAAKVFHLHRTGRPLTLNLIYPKPAKPELRLYLSARKGFKPAAGDIWFLYFQQERVYLGYASPVDWAAIRRGTFPARPD